MSAQALEMSWYLLKMESKLPQMCMFGWICGNSLFPNHGRLEYNDEISEGLKAWKCQGHCIESTEGFFFMLLQVLECEYDM